MADPVFKFERNAPKGKCPSCGANNKFRYYEGFHGDDRYGKCERLNECGFFAAPSAKDHPDYKPKKKEKNIEKSILFLDKKECDTVIENQDSNFHKFCLAAGISSEHLKKWLVGSDKNGNTVFFFKNRDGKFVNKKTGKYKEDGHRQKADGQEGFYSLPQPKDFKSKYVLCLFGEHILGKEKKPVCIVESEKTAIIASWHYPEYDWVSCGANTGLSDGTDDTNNKIGPLLGKEVWWLCDSDKAGRDNSSIRNIQKWFLEYKIIDLFKDRTDGWDIADEIISGKKPIIMPDKFNTVNVPLLPEKTGNWVYVPNNTRAAEKIDTLCILVGERQANVADHYGLRCVGIENLHGFLEKKLGENFHKTIQDLIGNKGVQRIVLVSNSDILHINYDPENTDKELGDKLMYNYKAIEKFKPCTINYDDIEFVFAHLASDLKNTAITLEELLNKMPDKRAEIIMELDRESEDHTWFHGFNICKYQLRKVREYFLIDYDQNIPKTFYRVFEDTLRESRWTLEGSTWQFSPMYGLCMVKHKDSFIYARIGVSYVKTIYVPNSTGKLDRRLEPWLKSEIHQDYVKEKKIADFIAMIPKYDAFCNVPANDDQYQQIIKNCYNLYYKMEHRSKQGEWPTIKKLLSHLFDNEYQSKIEVAYDYLTLLYRNPNQMLPIIVLASKEKNTGKSTFLWFMNDLFGENATIIGNAEFNDKWNDDYASKLVIGVDEGFLEKREAIERLKSMSTSPYINLSARFKSRQKISWFGKFIITTNDERGFLRIDSDETRFFICKIPVIKTGDPHLRAKMADEIPAFIHFLETRELTYPEMSRHWFETALLKTDALEKLMESSRRFTYKAIVQMIRSVFMEYEIIEFQMPIWLIRKTINDKFSYKKISGDDIQEELEQEFGIKIYPKTIRFKVPTWDNTDDENPVVTFTSKYHDHDEGKTKHYIGQPCTFKVQDWLKPEEYSDKMKEDLKNEVKVIEGYYKGDESENLPF